MADGTGIEWTEATWNPVVGCAHVSPGCDGCYAAREAAGRLAHLPTYAGLATRAEGEHARFTGEVRALPERLDQPSRWARPRRIFVNSMSDLFHPDLLGIEHVDRFDTRWPFVAEVVAQMVANPRHVFQVLTKRPPVMAGVLNHPRFRLDVNAILLRDGHSVMPGGMTDSSFRWPGHIWWGTSIETNRYKFRADALRDASAGLRWISAEPLLGPLDDLDLTGIDWLVVGAESGPRSRPMDEAWALDLVERCRAAGVPVFVKQLTGPGGRPRKALDEFPEALRVREYPAAVAALA